MKHKYLVPNVSQLKTLSKQEEQRAQKWGKKWRWSEKRFRKSQTGQQHT